GVISYITYGRHSYLFLLLWRFFPLFARLRVWGRMNIILVPLLAWLLSIAYARFEGLLAMISTGADTARALRRRALATLVGVAAVILGWQTYIRRYELHSCYWTRYFHHLASRSDRFVVAVPLTSALLIALLYLAARLRLERPRQQ